MLAIGALALGLVILLVGGTILVRGATEIAAAAGISPLVVGLTVVGFGTSAPELIINISGALNNTTGLAFGNAVGSNISNLALVLGVSVIFSPITIQGQLVRREVPLLLLGTTVMLVMVLDFPLEGRPPIIGRSESIVLLMLFCIFIYINTLDIVAMRNPDPLLADIEGNPLIKSHPEGRHPWLLVSAGIVLLAIGGETTVRSGIAVSDVLGISTTAVGLFMVAIGTSLPELVTSIIAAVRKEPDLALGNVVGSNIFNSLVVLPAGGLIRPIPVPQGGVLDISLSWVLAAVLIPVFFLGEARLGRKAGILLLALYLGYVIARLYFE